MGKSRPRQGRSRAGAKASRAGIVYLLSNPAMPGLLKIGMTSRTMAERLREINSATGVPMPYRVEAVVEAADARAVEADTHRLLGKARVNDRREFFRTDLRTALAAARKAARAHKGRLTLGWRGRLRPASILSSTVVSSACLPAVYSAHGDLPLPWLAVCAAAVLTGRPRPVRDLVMCLAGRGLLAHMAAAALGGIAGAALLRTL